MISKEFMKIYSFFSRVVKPGADKPASKSASAKEDAKPKKVVKSAAKKATGGGSGKSGGGGSSDNSQNIGLEADISLEDAGT